MTAAEETCRCVPNAFQCGPRCPCTGCHAAPRVVVVGDQPDPKRWWWRLEGKGAGLAHRFLDTEPACGEPSGPEQWTRAPASAPACAGRLRRPGR